MTTQEQTTGGLPGATGGALPADRDRFGPGVRISEARPGERRLASDPIPKPSGTYDGLDLDDVARVRAILRKSLPGLTGFLRDEIAEVLLRDGFRRG